MGLHDLLDDPEPGAEARVVMQRHRPLVRSEDAGLVLDRNAHALIANRKHSGLRLPRDRDLDDLASAILERIREEVQLLLTVESEVHRAPQLNRIRLGMVALALAERHDMEALRVEVPGPELARSQLFGGVDHSRE